MIPKSLVLLMGLRNQWLELPEGNCVNMIEHWPLLVALILVLTSRLFTKNLFYMRLFSGLAMLVLALFEREFPFPARIMLFLLGIVYLVMFLCFRRSSKQQCS